MPSYKAYRYRPQSQKERVEYQDPDVLYSRNTVPIWSNGLDDENDEISPNMEGFCTPDENGQYGSDTDEISPNMERFSPPAEKILGILPARFGRTVKQYTQEGKTQLHIAATEGITQGAVFCRMKALRVRAAFLAKLPPLYYDTEKLKRRAALALFKKDPVDYRIFTKYMETHNQTSVSKYLFSVLNISIKQPTIRHRLYKILNFLKTKDPELCDILGIFLGVQGQFLDWKYPWEGRTSDTAVKQYAELQKRSEIKIENARIRYAIKEEKNMNCFKARMESSEEILIRLQTYEPEFLNFLTPYMRSCVDLRLKLDPKSYGQECRSMLSHIHKSVRPRWIANKNVLKTLSELDVNPEYKECYTLRLGGLSIPEIANTLLKTKDWVRKANFICKLRVETYYLQQGMLTGPTKEIVSRKIARNESTKKTIDAGFRERHRAEIRAKQKAKRAEERAHRFIATKEQTRLKLQTKIAELQKQLLNLS